MLCRNGIGPGGSGSAIERKGGQSAQWDQPHKSGVEHGALLPSCTGREWGLSDVVRLLGIRPGLYLPACGNQQLAHAFPPRAEADEKHGVTGLGC